MSEKGEPKFEQFPLEELRGKIDAIIARGTKSRDALERWINQDDPSVHPKTDREELKIIYRESGAHSRQAKAEFWGIIEIADLLEERAAQMERRAVAGRALHATFSDLAKGLATTPDLNREEISRIKSLLAESVSRGLSAASHGEISREYVDLKAKLEEAADSLQESIGHAEMLGEDAERLLEGRPMLYKKAE